jgi:Domain of unknown function DUF29
MTAQTPLSIAALYEEDFILWTKKNAELLRRKEFDCVDWENLIEEVECTGRSERQAVESLLTQIVIHLLKISYWQSARERNARHWIGEIATFRVQLKKKMKTATLENHARDSFQEAYSDAREILIAARYVDETSIPLEPFFSLEQALDFNGFPIAVETFCENQP